MERFLKRHQCRSRGSISGFDRILFRGTFRTICYSEGVQAWLPSRRILFKDYAAFALGLSQGITDQPLVHDPRSTEPEAVLLDSAGERVLDGRYV